MPIYQLQLIAKQEVARGTIVFTFTKPEGFHFKPGQYAGFTLIKPSETDAAGITRRFSLLNTPDDDFIAFATRIQTSAYKRVLNTLPIGAEMKLAGPTGNFILHEDTTVPAVMIAGGIGITPFYSMLKDMARHQPTRKTILFYGNQTIQDAAFLNELTELQQANPNFTYIPVMAAEPAWQGETGFITATMLKKHISSLNTPIYYVCGSPNMVTALQETLSEMEIPEDHIKVEDFPGY